MKRGLSLFALAFIFLITSVSAQTCNLNTTLLNQNPYPAIPGDYVQIVFQLSGIVDATCGEITFSVSEEFPFSLDEGDNPVTTISSGTYIRNYETSAVIPYQLKIDESALDGANPIEVAYSSAESEGSTIQEFDIEIDDVRTDFEVSIKDYISSTRTLTFEILNIGENDAEALTIEIPKQENIEIKGSNRNIVGSLDSNEDTSFTFEAIPTDGQITLTILYTDEINTRRTLEKIVIYDSTYFTDRARDIKPTPKSYYFIGIVVLVIIIWYIRKRLKKKNKVHIH